MLYKSPPSPVGADKDIASPTVAPEPILLPIEEELPLSKPPELEPPDIFPIEPPDVLPAAPYILSWLSLITLGLGAKLIVGAVVGGAIMLLVLLFRVPCWVIAEGKRGLPPRGLEFC